MYNTSLSGGLMDKIVVMRISRDLVKSWNMYSHLLQIIHTWKFCNYVTSLYFYSMWHVNRCIQLTYDAPQHTATTVVIVNPSFSRVYGNDNSIDWRVQNDRMFVSAYKHVSVMTSWYVVDGFPSQRETSCLLARSSFSSNGQVSVILQWFEAH